MRRPRHENKNRRIAIMRTSNNQTVARLMLLMIMGSGLAGANAGKLPGTARTDSGADSLKVLGHASVKIWTAGGKVIYIDPYAGTDYADSADVVLITHQHADHNNLSLVRQKASCKVITNAQAFKDNAYQSFIIGDLKVDAVAAYNSNHPKGTGVGYVLDFDGIRLYHAGDTGKIDEMTDLASRNLTYALLPMDGIFNMTPEAAMEADTLIKPKYCIPIHTSPGGYSEAIVARFTADNKLVVKPGESIELREDAASVREEPGRPSGFTLGRNYPNPFNPSTTIEFSLPRSGFVTLKIYDLLGREKATLISGHLGAGTHRALWNAGNAVSGIYFYRLKAEKSVGTGRLILSR
jgi:L-ascorbate metabolism protein UlaG (beta-lactamase superfamily)